MSKLITVWEFRSVDGSQVVTAVHTMRDDDYTYQHEYQRIVYRGPLSGYTARKELSI